MRESHAVAQDTANEMSFSLGTVTNRGELVEVVFSDSDKHELADAQSLLRAIAAVSSRINPPPMLTDVRATSAGPSKAAREFYSSSAAQGFASCSALLVDSTYQKLLGNFFSMFSPPKVPFRLFNDEGEARSWLRSQHTSS